MVIKYLQLKAQNQKSCFWNSKISEFWKFLYKVKTASALTYSRRGNLAAVTKNLQMQWFVLG